MTTDFCINLPGDAGTMDEARGGQKTTKVVPQQVRCCFCLLTLGICIPFKMLSFLMKDFNYIKS